MSFLHRTSSVLILVILLQSVSCSCNLQKVSTSAEMLGALDLKNFQVGRRECPNTLLLSYVRRRRSLSF